MGNLSDSERHRIFDEVRREQNAKRHRQRPDYTTISAREAKRLGYHAVTAAYSTRQFDQCAMLDAVIADFKGVDTKLVRVGVRKNMIEVWRK